MLFGWKVRESWRQKKYDQSKWQLDKNRDKKLKDLQIYKHLTKWGKPEEAIATRQLQLQGWATFC
jgi:hypothetical protein